MSLIPDPDLINAIGSIATLALGLVAIREWRRQHRATEDHAIAKSLLLAAYSLRDGVQFVRSPFLFYSTTDEHGKKISEWEGQCKEYDRRLDEARKRRAVLEASIAEANALWSIDVRPWFMGLIEAHSSVSTYVPEYLEDRIPDKQQFSQKDPEFSAMAKSISMAKHDGSDDFSIKLNQSLDGVAGKLRERMIK